MSDESPPPPALRLKPRLRPEGDAPPATPPAEGGPATPSPAGGEAPKIRLRPRLMAQPPAEGASTAAAAPAEPAKPATIPASGLIGENAPPPSWAAGGAAPAASTSPAGEGAPKIRIKPAMPDSGAAAQPAVIPAAIPAIVPPAETAASAPPPPAVVPAIAPPAAAPASPPAPGGEPGAKFKLKPKSPLPPGPGVIAPPPAAVPGVPPVSAPPPVPGGPVVPPLSGEATAAKAPPPFPVVAPPKSGTTAPPIPHIAARAEVVEPEAPAPRAHVPFFKKKAVQLSALAALLVLGGGFVAWQQLGGAKPAPAPAPAAKQTPPPAPAPAAPKAAAATPSETLNNLAHAPANAINKAQDAIAARNASGQADVAGALGEELANKPAATDPKAPRQATASRPVAPGVTATTARLEVAAEASPAFRTYVANLKVSSVLPPTRAFINERVTRTGDTVDATLGIVFDSVDEERRQLVFRDRTGATVARRY